MSKDPYTSKTIRNYDLNLNKKIKKHIQRQQKRPNSAVGSRIRHDLLIQIHHLHFLTWKALMKKNTQKHKSPSKKKANKRKESKPNKSKRPKTKFGDSKPKNKVKPKHVKDSKQKGSFKVIKDNKKNESKLEYKKRLNRLYSSLLLNHKDPLKSKEPINSLLKELPPNYCQASNKRNVSRILQASLKYGDASVRSEVFQKCRDNFSLSNLNAHSSKFLIKLFHYCNVEVKEFLKSSFFNEKQKNLLFSRFGSDVMDVIYIKLKSKEQLGVLKLYCLSNTFYLNQEENRRSKEINSITQLIELISSSGSKDSCLEKMASVVTKLVEKELLTSCISHDVLYVYLHLLEDKTEIVSQAYKIFGQLLSTRNGNNCMIMLMEYANNKIKKFVTKSLKRDFPEAAYNQINVHLLIKVVNVTDDTKLTGECLIEPLMESPERAVFDKNASKFVMNVLDTTHENTSQNSLKDPKVRKEEVQNKMVPTLVEFFKNTELRVVVEDKYAGPILLHTLKVSKDKDLVEKVVELFKQNPDQYLENPLTLRFFQSLVKSNNKVSSELVEFKVGEKIWESVKGKAERLVESKAIFLLVDLLESFENQGLTELLKDFKSRVTPETVSRAKEKFKEEHSTGLDLLLSHLK